MNKIKGSSSAVKMKYLLFVFAAAVLVALPTRVYQLLALVDASNGFYKESDVTIPVLYGVAIVFGLLFMALSFISKEVPSPKLPAGKNAVLGIASFVMVAGLGADMLGILKKIVPANQGNAAIFINLFKANLSKNGGTFTILEFVFAFFAIIYFLVFCFIKTILPKKGLAPSRLKAIDSKSTVSSDFTTWAYFGITPNGTRTHKSQTDNGF